MPQAIDETTIQPLVDNHRAFLRYLERRVGSREEAEDILQEAFGRSLDRLEALGGDENVVRWFYRVLRNAVTDHYRREAAASRAPSPASSTRRWRRRRYVTRSAAACGRWP
jgi:RNA polymerase sigma-70 factor (ECF subfamily)